MWHGVKSFFHVIIVFQCIIFVLYLFSHKDVRKSSKYILAAFLITKAITEAGGILGHFLELRTLLINDAPLLLYAYYPFKFAYIPLLYFYIIALTNRNFNFKKIYWLHFTPFLIVAVYMVIKFYMIDINLARDLIDKREFLKGVDYNIIKFFEYVQFFYYTFLSLIVIKKYRLRIKNAFSSVEKINLSWLNFVIWGLISWKSIRLADYLLFVTIEDISKSILYILYITAEIAFLAFITLLFLKGLKQPMIFFGILEEAVKGKYERTGLSDLQKKTYEKTLKQFMENERPYLDPSLNIKDLASKLSLPTHHLSQVINSNINQNFFDFINSYRIEESKKLLEQYSPREKTVLEILYEVGFNSKSVYNTVFKKYTGMTPTQYREKLTLKVA